MKKILFALCLSACMASNVFAAQVLHIQNDLGCTVAVFINAHFSGISCTSPCASGQINVGATSTVTFTDVTDINLPSTHCTGTPGAPGWSCGACADLSSAWDWDWVAVIVPSGIGFNVANPAWCNYCTGCNTHSSMTSCSMSTVTVDWSTNLAGDYTVHIHL